MLPSERLYIYERTLLLGHAVQHAMLNNENFLENIFSFYLNSFYDIYSILSCQNTSEGPTKSDVL